MSAGERRMVAVSGEPGVGKSALVGALRDAIATEDEPPLVAGGQCI